MESWESIEKQLVDVKQNSWTSLLQFYGILRSFFYTAEMLPLSVLQPTYRKALRNWKDQDLNRLKQVLNEVWLLIQQDSERVTAGMYPVSVLQPEWNWGHWSQLIHIWYQGFKSQTPQFERKGKRPMNSNDLEALRDIPNYYKHHQQYSNFRFLDPHSASMYEHQMELLFLGSMDAMRRLLLAPMKRAFRFSEGEGLRFLEVGSGSGRMTRFIKLSFPKARIVVLDASPAYLKEAQKNLREFNRVDFIQGDALDLPFKDEQFDVVYSSFLIHELPLELRRKALLEFYRVLSKKGWLGIVDLLQVDDARELNWTLDQTWFAPNQPHLKDYVRNSLSGTFHNLGLEQIGQERGFLGKVVYGTK